MTEAIDQHRVVVAERRTEQAMQEYPSIVRRCLHEEVAERLRDLIVEGVMK